MAQTARKIKPVSFDDMLAKTAKPKTAKKKAKSQVANLETPKEIRDQVDRYIEAKKAEKIAKTEKDDAGEHIIGFVRPMQDREGYGGMFRHSYAVSGNNGNKVKFVSSNRFSISAEDEDQLLEILGDEFDTLIERNFDVMLKPEVFQDEGLKTDLMSLVGARFGEFFDTKVSLKVREEFDRRVYGTVGEKDLPALRTFARPYKPSLR